jgi:peptide/nickel transport system ATP-binding protein
MSLLEVTNLRVEFPTLDGVVTAVDGISFSVEKGETLAIVGESGCGKSVSNLALMGLLPKRGSRVSGKAKLTFASAAHELIDLPEEEIQKIRGNKVSMIFQDPMSSLHPFFTIGDQIIEAHQVHNSVSKEVSANKAIELLKKVGISEPELRMKSFPHQFSGGMRQRVMIAMALINEPELLIADEPTTALDVTVQAQILKLLKELQQEMQMAIILISHDLGVVAGAADRVNVMYAGKLVESAKVDDLFAKPLMPYTSGLLASIPKPESDLERLSVIPGQPPSLLHVPKGCAFHPRCSYSNRVVGGVDICKNKEPELVEKEVSHFARCHLESNVVLKK